MKIKMEVRGLWVAVDPDSVEFQVDRMALDAICSVVSSEMITTLTTSDSTQEAWESIMVMCIDNDRIRKASAQKLRREYEVPKFRDKEGVEDFTM
jgi:lysyl-tRNA synthetase class I